MKASERLLKIQDYVRERGFAAVTDLALLLGVSENTVRNDLDLLADKGVVERTHGGAEISRTAIPPALRPRNTRLTPACQMIINYALTWVEDGDSMIIGDGVICTLFAEELVGLRNLRVITPALGVAFFLAQEPSNRIILAGGELDADSLSTSGPLVEASLRNFKAGKAFISVEGVSAQSGFTEGSVDKAALELRIFQAADSTFVLVDSSRVGKMDLFPVVGLDAARRIITDDGVTPDAARNLTQAGARVAVCALDGHQTYRQRYSAGKQVTIGFANLSHQVSFSRDVLGGLQKAVREADGVELIVADNRTDPAVAIANARDLIEKDIDLLIEYDGTGLATRTISRMARAADIPLIAVDIPIMGATHIGCDHDAAGTCAGEALGKWILDNWHGKVDELLWVTNEGGATISSNMTHKFEYWQRGSMLSESLSPAIRFEAALEALDKVLSNKPEVRQLVLPGGWASSNEAINLHVQRLLPIIKEIPTGKRVAVICLVNEGAIGFARAARQLQRCEQFAVIGFGGISEDEVDELQKPGTCLAGFVNLHPERYGGALLNTAIKILRSESVSPALFLSHDFVSAVSYQQEVQQ